MVSAPSPDARIVASIDALVGAPRGAACSRELACADGLTCEIGLHAYGGYCASSCESCDGTCVGTPRGEMCMAACASDRDCRASEGYVCDRQWKACAMPNSTAIVPRTCDPPRGIGRDPAFAPTVVLSKANIAHHAPTLATLPDGTAVALFADSAGLGGSRSDAGGREPWLAQAKGTLFAVWSAGKQIALATSKTGTTWSAAVNVQECEQCRPMVVARDVVYLLYSHEGLRVRASRDGGKTFEAPITALPGGYGNATVGADGRLHVIAIDGNTLGGYGSANQRIQYTVSADGGRTFARAITVSRRDEMLPFYFANPSVAVDTRRKWVYVAYVRGGRDGVWDILLAASKDGGATWTRTRIGDEPTCAIHMVPNLALDPTTGTLHVGWYDSRGLRFAHATCTAGLAWCKQVGRINDVPFAAMSTVRNAPVSISDRASLVIDDKRRLLHAVWSQPVTEEGKVVSRVFHTKATLPLR